MLLSAAGDAFVNFIKEEYILLIIIAIAIVLLIVVSLMGRKKKPKDGAETTDANSAENTAPAAIAETETAETVSEVKAEEEKPEEANEEETAETPAETTEDGAEKAEEAEATAETEPEIATVVEAEEVKETESEETVSETADEAQTESLPEEVKEDAAEDKKAQKAVKEQEVVEDDTVEVVEDAESITRPGIVEIYKGKEYKDKDGNLKENFYFTFRSFHGYMIGRSQGYSSKDSCKNGVQAVMNACAAADVYDNAVKKPVKNYSPKFGNAMFEMYKDTEGKFRFRLFAKNAENVAASFGYKTKANLKSGIESLKRIATNYILKDSTKKKPADKA